MTPEQKHAEELKRECAYDPRRRWEAILDAIAFAEQNFPAGQRRNRPRWHADTRSRATLAEPFVATSPPDASTAN